MSTSSGIYADSYDDTRACLVENEVGEDCEFYGEVEVFFDPEVFAAWWTCPLCKHEHEEGWENDL